MFRRRFLKPRYFFLPGRCVSLRQPDLSPLDLDLMLVFRRHILRRAGIAVVLDRRARNRQDLEVLKRIYAGFIPLPWILARRILQWEIGYTKKLSYHAATVDGRYNRPGVVRGTRRLSCARGRDRSTKGWRWMPTTSTVSRLAIPGSVGVEPGAAWHSLVLRRLSSLVLAAPHISTWACRRVSGGFAIPGCDHPCRGGRTRRSNRPTLPLFPF